MASVKEPIIERKTPFSYPNLINLIRKPHFQPEYLDTVLNSQDSPTDQISAVVATYNRSPHDPSTKSGRLNPLSWYISSLLSQKRSGLDEIIIVDDASEDFTEEVVESFRQEANDRGIDIIYMKNNGNQGSSISRNQGVDVARNQFIMFGDDDCVLSKYALFGAIWNFNQLREKGINIAAVHLPVYPRSTEPIGTKKIEEIGVLDVERGRFTGNLHHFPLEYLEETPFYNEQLKILEALEIRNLSGVFLIDKKIFNQAGEFPDYFIWRNAYSEETELSVCLSELGYKIFFTPDPKFSTIHLKFGAEGNVYLNGRNWEVDLGRRFGDLSLERMVRESHSAIRNTGNRVDPEEWAYSKIISYLVVLLKRNYEGGLTWARNMFEQFVENNETQFSAGIGQKIDGYERRTHICTRAIQDGVNLINMLTGKSISEEEFISDTLNNINLEQRI